MEQYEAGHVAFVSLQGPGYELATEGHVARGLLVDDDRIVVPNLPRQLADTAHSYDALIVARPYRDDLPFELIKTTHVEAHGVEEGGSDLAALFRLARPSQLFTPQPLPVLTKEEFLRLVQENKGNLWAVLAELGVAPDEEPSEALAGIRTAFPVDACALTKVVLHSRLMMSASWFCCVTHLCQCT